MKSTVAINLAGVLPVCFVIAVATASCDRRIGDDEQVMSTSAEAQNKESKKKLSRGEMLEDEFRRIMDTTYSEVTIKNSMAACRATGQIEDEVAKLPVDEAVPLLDRFMDMTLEASLAPVTNYPSQYKYSRPIHIARIAWFDKMFYIASQTFYASMELRADPYEDWEKLFAFFGKFTNEVAMVSRCQPIHNDKKTDYLLNIKDNFKMYVHQVRDIAIKHHKTKPTEKQKAEIFRRFEELEKYVETLVPPRKTGAEEQQTLNRNDAPIVPARKEEFDANRFHPQLVM